MKRGFCFSAESGNIIVFSTCMSRSFSYCPQIAPFTVTWFHLPHRASSLPHTRTQLDELSQLLCCTSVCLSLYSHWERAVRENFNIQVSDSALPSLLTGKKGVGEKKKMVKCFEWILKILQKRLKSQNIHSLNVLQLVLLWSFPGIKIIGNFSTTCFLLFSHHILTQPTCPCRGDSGSCIKGQILWLCCPQNGSHMLLSYSKPKAIV